MNLTFYVNDKRRVCCGVHKNQRIEHISGTFNILQQFNFKSFNSKLT